MSLRVRKRRPENAGGLALSMRCAGRPCTSSAWIARSRKAAGGIRPRKSARYLNEPLPGSAQTSFGQELRTVQSQLSLIKPDQVRSSVTVLTPRNPQTYPPYMGITSEVRQKISEMLGFEILRKPEADIALVISFFQTTCPSSEQLQYLCEYCRRLSVLVTKSPAAVVV